jgi:DNA protecting protein DprA
MNSTFFIKKIAKPAFQSLDQAPPLWQVSQPPAELFAQGNHEALSLLERLPEAGFAIVGTRSPQPRSQALVRKIVSELEGTPLIIISGFARGIDTTAHLAALDAGLPTIAVLGTPLNVNYPAENHGLRTRILEAGGLLISEFAENTPFYSSYFIRRNRLIAGWAKATWIVEASYKSGALNTAKWAREQHRTCFATPCFPGDPALAGTQKLLDEDAASPLWSTEGLGAAWNFLTTPYKTRQRARKKQGGPDSTIPGASTPDSLLLQHEVRLRSAACGRTTVQEILDWAIIAGWSPQRFFLALQNALQDGKIDDQEGTLVPGH